MSRSAKLLRVLAVLVVGLAAGACSLSNPPGKGTRWTNYPGLPGTSRTERWLIVKCKVADISSLPPHFDRRIDQFFGLAGAGYGNLVDYFFDVSYHHLHFRAEPLATWVTAPFESNEIKSVKRKSRVEQCLNAVPRADLPDLDAFSGVIVMTNHVLDAGSCGTGKQTLTIHGEAHELGCLFFDPGSLFINFAAHEIGHGIGMVHSFDDSTPKPCNGVGSPGEYCDPWDMMSAMSTFAFADGNFFIGGFPSRAGPGLDVPNLMNRGWLPPANLRWFDQRLSEQTFTIRALSHPRGNEPLAVLLAVNGSGPSDGVYTVEYRQADGWDRAFASGGAPERVLENGGAVLVHRFGGEGAPVSTVIKRGNRTAPDSTPIEGVNRGALLPPADILTIDGSAGSYWIRVVKFDRADGSATITIGHGKGTLGLPFDGAK